ncbi:hypothetical protein [Pseudomonas sp. RIT-PI-AD]|uniref:hypothetical protein n=1 Tax=Pseudomonas sp. RIT-PI-AD TaxID=3035294 RepID=UPI0021DB1401|nr:hypothetical protein [Pseudomonas sp. RIT-PI-AD]
MPLYREGSLALTKGQKKAIGNGTTWGLDTAPGDLLIVDGLYYEVASVESDTELTLDAPAETSYSGAYLIVRSISTANNLYLMRKIEQFLQDRQATLGQLEALVPELEQVLADAQAKLAQMGNLSSYVSQALSARDVTVAAREVTLEAKGAALAARDTALTAKNDAAASASAASAAQASALASKDAASTSATAAASSKTAAESAKSAATVSETNAASSAAAALASKSAASASEVAAAASKVSASASEAAALNSKNAAVASESVAQAAKTAAAASATKAAEAETNAANHATAALASKTAAAASEAKALSAGNAAAESATAAARSAAEAASVAAGEIINDSSTGTNRTWSAQKIAQQVGEKLDKTATAVNSTRFAGLPLERFALFETVNPKTLSLHAPTPGSGYQHAALELREVQGVLATQSSDDYAPRIAFHWGNRVASVLTMHADGNLFWDEKPLYHSGNARVGLLEKPTATVIGYDGAGRLASVSETVGGVSKTIALTYNPDGTLLRSVETLGSRVRTETFTYASGRLAGSSITEVNA